MVVCFQDTFLQCFWTHSHLSALIHIYERDSKRVWRLTGWMIESQKISQFTPFCWNNDIKVLHGKSQEWTCDPWFVKILRTQRSSEVHVDSTFLHRCRVGALIYDSEAGWSHKDPQSITMLSVASADPGLNMSGIPSPRSSDTHTHIIKIIAYFCILPSTSFNYTNYTDYWWRVDNPRHATMHAMYARFWILIIGRRLWPVIQSQPSAACTTHAFGIPDSCRCPRGRISVYGCMREEQRLSFVDIVLPCSAHPALNFTLIRKYPLRICQIALCCIQNGWSAQYSYTLFSNLRCGCIEWTKSRNWSSICKLVWLVMNELSYVMRTLETDCFPLEIFWSPICVKVLSDSEGIRNGAGVGIPST